MRTKATSRPRPLASSLARYGSFAAACVAISLATEGKAGTFYWDAGADGDGTLGGTGIWNLTGLRWDPTGTDLAGATNIAWPNTDADIAVFRGTAGVVTLNTAGTGVTAGGLSFETSGFSIVPNAAGDVITLGGATPTITINNAAHSASISTVLAGNAGLILGGAGTLTLAGTNTYAGGTTIGAGTLVISADANLGAAAAPADLNLAINGGTLRVDGTFSSARTLTVGTGGTTVDVLATRNLTLSSAVSAFGVDSLVKTGAGTLTLGSASTRTGLTDVNAGSVVLTNSSGLGTGDLTISGGASVVSAHNAGGQNFPSNVQLSGGTFSQNQAQQLNFATGKALTIGSGTNVIDVSGAANAASKILLGADQLKGSGAFTKTGIGTLQLSGANPNFSGATTIAGGVIEAQNTAALGGATGSPVTITGGELVASGILFPNAITLNGGRISSNGNGGADFQGAINVTGNSNIALRYFHSQGTPNNLKISGALSGSGNLTVSAPAPTTTAVSSLFLASDTSAYTGTLTIGQNAQVRALQGTGVDGFGSLPITLSGGTLGIAPVVTPGANTGIQGRWVQNPLIGTSSQIGNGVIGGFDFGNFTYAANQISSTPTLNVPDVTVAGNRPAGITAGVNLGVLWTGILNVTGSGQYTFTTTSDDASLLYVDGQPVVLNDFSQGATARSGVISLTPGAHSIVVKYGQGTGGGSMVANYQGPDTGNVSVVLGSVANTLTNNGSTIQGSSTIDNAITLTPNTTSAIDLAATTATGTGSITFGAGSRLNFTGLTGSETFTQQGAVTLNGIYNTIGTGVPQVINNAQNQSAGADVTIVPGIGESVVGSALTKTGPRTLTLSANNTYTGLTTVAGGTLNLNAPTPNAILGNVLLNASLVSSSVTLRELASNQIPDTATVTLAGYSGLGGSTLDLNGFNDTVGAITFANNQASGTQSISTGTGVLTLNGNVLIAGTSTGANTISGNLDLGGVNRTFTVTGVSPGAISAAITNGSITKNGLGTLTLSGANPAYSGLTTISGGRLVVSDAGALGTTASGSETVVSNGGVLDIANVTVAEPITLNGFGQPNFSNTAVNNFGLMSTGALVGSGGFAGTASGPITLGSNAAVGAAPGNLLTISGVISDGGSAYSLTKTGGNAATLIGTGTTTGGPGIVKLTGINTYTGATIVESGDLWLNSAGQTLASTSVVIGNGKADATLTAVGTNNQFAPGTILTFNGGSKNAKFQLNGTTQTIAGFNVSGSLPIIQNHENGAAGPGTLIVDNATDTSFNGLIRSQNNTLALTKQGAGTLTLDGNGVFGTAGATYTGATTVSAGKLVLKDQTAFVSAVTLNGTGSLEINESYGRGLVYTGVITDNGLGFTKSGAGSLALSGINVVTGQVNVTGGVLNLTDATGNVNPLPNAPINVSAGAQLQLFGVTAVTTTFNNNVTLNGLTPGGAFSGAVVAGTPTNTLTGTLTLAATSNISTGWSDKTLNLNGKISGPGGLVIDKLLYTQNPPVVNITSATNDYAGGTTINSGTVNFSAGALPSTGNLKFGGTFGNGGNVGVGQLVLSTGGTNGFTRSIGTGSGEVQFTGDGGGFTAVGSVQTVTFGNAGPLSWTGTGTTGLDANASLVFNTGNGANNEVAVTNDINLNSGMRRIVTGAASSRFSGVISGTAGLILDGAGTHNFSGASGNTYTGLTNLSGGTLILAKTSGNAISGDVQISNNQGGTRRVLRLGANDQIADTATLTFVGSNANNGDFRLFGFNETVAGIQDRSGGGVIEVVDQGESATSGLSTLTINGSGDSFYNGFFRNQGGTPTVGGVLALVKEGTGTLTISAGQQSGGGSQTYTGTTTVNGGRLVFANIGTYNSPVTIGTAGTLEFLTNLNQNLTDGQVISGEGKVVKTGSGTLALGAFNTYTGSTTINAGTLVVGNGTTGGVLSNEGGIVVNAGGTLAFARNDGYLQAGVISGAGDVETRTAGGIISLTGANTYTGRTIANAGTINLTGTGISRGGLIANSGGRINLDFFQSASAQTNLVASATQVTLAGGTLGFNVPSTGVSSQTLGPVSVIGAGSAIIPTVDVGGALTLNLGVITASPGSSLEITLPAGATVKTTTPGIGGILGGFATTNNGTQFVAIDGTGLLTPLAPGSNDTYGAALNTNVVAGGAGATTNSLRFDTAAANTVTFTGANSINSGGILVTSNVGANDNVITGGTIRGGASNTGITVLQNNSLGSLRIGSIIADNGGASAVTKDGGGTLITSGANTYSGGTFVRGGTLINLGSLGTGTATTNSGATLQIGDGTVNGVIPTFGLNQGSIFFANATAQSLTTPINALSEANFTNNPTASSTTALAGNVTKIGPGTLTISVPIAANTFHQRAGTTVLTTGSNVVSNSFNAVGQLAGDTATLTVEGIGRITQTGDFNVGDVSATGTLNLREQGVITAGNFFAGKFGTAVGVVNQTLGTLVNSGGNADWRIGGSGSATDSAAYGVYNISGGSLTTGRNFQIGAFGRGVINQTGGAITQTGSFPVVGRFTGGVGLYNLSNGTFADTNTGTSLILGENGTGVLNLSGAATMSMVTTTGGGVNGLRLAHGSGGVGIANLLGGTMVTTGISKGSGATGLVNFNGGVLRVQASTTALQSTFMQGLNGAVVYSGGANIDTNNINITIGQPLLAPTASGVSAISVATAGSGYVGEPIVQLTGGAGSGATARAVVSGGAITGFVITNPGSGYAPGDVLTASILGGGGTGAAAGTVTLAPNVTTGGLNKLNTGTLLLNTASTYGGATTITGGTLQLDYNATSAPASGANMLPATSNLVLNGGSLLVSGKAAATPITSQTFAGLTLNAPGTITGTIGAGGTVNIALNGITKNAGGAVNFVLPATGSISTLTANAATSILGGWATVAGTNWAVSAGTGSVAGNVTALGTYVNNTWAAGNNTTMAANTPVANLTTNSVRFNTATPSTVTITGTSVITSGGILITPTATAAATIFTGGTLNSGGTTTDLVVHHFGTANATITSAIGAGTGGLVKAGTGVLILNSPSGTNLYTGATTIGAGTLRLGVANQIPDSSAVTIAAGATFDLNNLSDTIGTLSGYGTVANSVAGTPTLTVGNGGGSSTFSGAINTGTGNVAITKVGAGSLTFNNITAGSYTGATNINAGSIVIAAPNALSNNTQINVNTTGGLKFDTTVPVISGLGGNSNFALETQAGAPVQLTLGSNNATATFTGGFTGAGTLVKVGTGVQFVNGATTNSGGFVANGGTLAFNGNNSGATGNIVANSGGTVQFGAANSFIGAAGRTVLVANGGAVTFAAPTANPSSINFGPITAGLSRIDQASTGILALQSDSSVQAPITENLDFAAAGLNLSLGATLSGVSGAGNSNVVYTGVITPNQNTFRLGGGGGRLILPNSGTLAGANDLNIGGSGGGGLLYLTGEYGYTGVTTIHGGGTTLVTDVANGGSSSSLGAAGAAASNLVLNGGTLQYVGVGGSTDRLFTLTTTPTTLDASGSGPLNFTNAGAIGLVNVGNRTLTLQGNNIGANTIAGAISDAVNVPGSANTIGNGVTSITKNGNGTWVVSGTNSFSGGVTINNGVLAFAAPASIGANTVNGPASVLVNSGGAAALGAGFNGSLQTSLIRISPLSTGTIALTGDSNEPLNFDGGAAGAGLPTAYLGAYGNVTYTGTVMPFGNTYRFGGGGGVLTMPNGGLTGPRIVQIGGGGPGSSFVNGPNLNGAVVLGGSSDYSGGTILNPGALLSVTNLGALGTGPLKFQGGFYRAIDSTDITLAADGVSAREIRLGADASANAQTANVEVIGGVDLTFSKTFGIAATLGSNLGQQNFTKWGAGTLILANGINLGTSNGTNNVATNSGTLAIERGTLSILSNPTAFNGLIQVGSNNGGVGTLKLGGNDVFGGGGSLLYGSGNVIDVYSGSKIDLNGFSDTIRNIRGFGSIVNTGASSANLTVGSANEVGIIGGNLIGNFTLTRNGTVTNLFGTGATINSLELWNNNNSQFTGKLVATAGGIRLRADGTLGASDEPFKADKITLKNNAVLLSTSNSVVIGANHGITLGEGGGTIWVPGTTGMVINSPITGSGPLTIADDTGVVSLASDSNNWTGGTVINSNASGRGLLTIGAGGTTGSIPAGPILFNSGSGLARLFFFKSNDMIVSNDINGPGLLLQIGGGTTTLTGNNTTNQTTYVAGGKLRADFTTPGKSPIGTGTGLNLSAGTFEYVAPAGDNTLRLQALAGTVFSGTNGLSSAVQIGGGIGDATLVSTYGGSGTQVLLFNGLSRGTAGVTTNFVTNGGVNGITNTIRFQTGPALNAVMGGAFYFNGTEFAAYDANGFVRAANHGGDSNASAVNTLVGSQWAKLTNPISGQAAIGVSGINLSGPNASLNLAASAALTVNGNPGALMKTGGGTSIINGDAGATVSNNNQELILRADSASDTLQIDVPITGTGQLTKSGLGRLTLTAANTATGNLLMSQGTLLLTGSGQLGTNASPTGELRIATVAGQSATVLIDSPGAGITMANGANALRIGEAGTGFVTQSEGTVNVSNYLTIGESLGAAGTYTISGGTLNVKTNNGTPPAGAAGQNNFVVGRAGSGSVEISGTAAVNVLNGAQILLGMGTNNSGQFQGMTPNASISTGVGSIVQNGGTVNVAFSNGVYQSNLIGAVILGVDGTGSYALNGGTLTTPMLGRGNGEGSFTLGSGVLKAAANTLNVDLPIALTGTGAGRGSIDTNGNNVTFTGALTGTGGVVKSGSGTLALIGSGSTFTGGTDIASGNVVASGTSLGTGAVNVGAGASLTLQGVQEGLLAKFYAVNTTGATPGVTAGNASMATELSSLENFKEFLDGKNAIAVESTAARGKLSVNYLESANSALPPALIALAGGGSPFVGSLTGKFNAPTGGEYTFQTRSDDGSMLWIDGQAVLDNNRGQGQTTRTGTIFLSPGEHDIVVGYQQGSGGFGFSVGVTVPGQGQSFLTGSELNMPNSLLSHGSNELKIGSLSGAGVVELGNGKLAAGSDNTSTVFSGSISGQGGTFTKEGLGTMTLSGANTYTGPTIVDAGGLNVGSSAALQGSIAGSAVTLKNGTKLGGYGSLGSLNALAGSIVSPGSELSRLGTLNITNGLTLSNGALFSLDLGNTQTGQPLASDYDSLNVTGGVSLNNANLSVSLFNSGIHFADNTGDIFYLILNDGADAVNGRFFGLGQGDIFASPDGRAFKISYTADSLAGSTLAGFNSATGNDVAIMAVPEPSASMAILAGLSSLAGLRRFRRRR